MLQESNLFFVALDRVKAYAAAAGFLPLIVSENVQGVWYKQTAPKEVCPGVVTCQLHQHAVRFMLC